MFLFVLGQARTQNDEKAYRASVPEQGGTLGAKKCDLTHRTIHKQSLSRAIFEILVMLKDPSY
jgi:hypothetical protein